MSRLRLEERSALERNALPETPAGLEACHPAQSAAVAAIRTTSVISTAYRMKVRDADLLMLRDDCGNSIPVSLRLALSPQMSSRLAPVPQKFILKTLII